MLYRKLCAACLLLMSLLLLAGCGSASTSAAVGIDLVGFE